MKRAKNNKAAGVWQREAAHTKTPHLHDTTYQMASTPIPHDGQFAPAILIMTINCCEPLYGISLEELTPRISALEVNRCTCCTSLQQFAIGLFRHSPNPIDDSYFFLLCEQCFADATLNGLVTAQFVEMMQKKVALAERNGFKPASVPMP